MAKRKNHKTNLTSLITICIALLIGFVIANFSNEEPSAPLNPPQTHITDELRVHFIDVGQADCQIIQLPTGQTMMIDAGNNDDGYAIMQYLDSLDITKIDYLVGTHPHEDHIGSLDTVIDNYDIGAVYMPSVTADTKSYRDVISAIETSGLSLTSTKSGITIYADDNLTIQTVAPVYDYYESLNNYSVVIRITYKDSSFLFTGDAEEESENDITLDVSADVLSVGHHGSSTSTSDAFLSKVDPMYAVISCGVDNDYGHPHYETLDKLQNDDITVYRTDRDGTLICTTKGKKGDYTWESVK